MRLILALVILATNFMFAQHLQSDPMSLREDITVTELVSIESNAMRIEVNLADGQLYYMLNAGQIWSVNPSTGERSFFAGSSQHGVTRAQGFTISDDGIFYIIDNEFSNNMNSAEVVRGEKIDDNWVWTPIAETEPYPLSDTFFDHLYNGAVVSPDGQYLFFNSGSRTDHGEVQHNNNAFPDIREVPLTSAILRIPTDADGLYLPNDEEALVEGGYLYADGFRNSFDLAFAPNGDLFATENSGDRDDSDELNWIREGHHYGFPWRMGTNDTPQQFPDYDPDTDLLINHSAYAWQNGFFYNDPDYPPPPDGVTFTDPIMNNGPDADKYRNPDDASIHDASDEGMALGTFTAHKSPLGLVFDKDSSLTEEFIGDGFMLGWTDTGSSLFGPFGDPGEDLLHLEFTKIEVEERYEVYTTRLVEGFKNPIDAVMLIDNIYVLEFDFGSWQKIWKVTLPSNPTNILSSGIAPQRYRLHQNYPNPFNPSTVLSLQLAVGSVVDLAIYDVNGQLVRKLVKGERLAAGAHSFIWDGTDRVGKQVASGVYFYQMRIPSGSDSFTQTMKMLLIR